MSAETSRPSGLSKDPVRIVYHTDNRTFARLFNERSLEEVKDVVRRKLGLGKEASVSLKQMGRDALLDLEDDDDFQAFRVFLNSSISVDIAVTVDNSQGAAIPPPPREHASECDEITIPSASTSRGPTTTSRPSVEPHSTRTEASHKRKHRVSFDDAASMIVSHRTAKKRTAEPAAPSQRTASAVKPPTKRQKKEVTRKRQPEVTESSQASSVSRLAAEESIALEGANEVATSMFEDGEISPRAMKKQKRLKKDAGSDLKKSSAAVKTVAPDTDQENNTVNVPALQLASAKPGTSGVVGSTSKSRKSKAAVEGVCATIPGTNESAVVESEVTAAILSQANEFPLELPVKPQPIKTRVVRKTTASSRASAKSTGWVNTSNLEMILPPCPICQGVPFHIRYFCPIYLKGPDAIQARLEELKGMDEGKKEWLIREIEGILREARAASMSSTDAAPTNTIQTTEVSPPPDTAPISRTADIPANSRLSEVTVESGNERSGSESLDVMSDGEVEPKGLSTSRNPQTLGEKLPPVDDDLEAVIRGPARKQQSILNVLDRIVGNEDEEEDSDSKEVEAELEEDPDEDSGRSKHRLSKLVTHSSDSGSEEDVSGSPSPLPPSRGSSGNPGLAEQPSTEFPGESIHQQNDIIMSEPVGALNVEGQDGDSSEETHVGSDGRMIVDEFGGETGASTNKRASPVPRDSVLRSPDARSDEPQGPDQTEANPTPDGVDGLPGPAENPTEIDADPIEPADDLQPPVSSRSSNVDPIEVPCEDSGAFFSGMTQSTPKPGVTKRIKTRSGQILDDEAEGPVLLEQLTTEVTNGVASLPRMRRTEDLEASTSQEPVTTRKSPRFSTLPSSTSTPAAVALMNHKAKGARSIKATKTPARRSGAQNDTSQKGHPATTPTIRWETLAEPLSSPSVLPDEPSVLIDELMSSSPDPEVHSGRGRRQVKGKGDPLRRPTAASHPEINSTPHGGERLFDLTPSQIPFPYSQHKDPPARAGLPNGTEEVDATDSEEEEPKGTKVKAKPIARFRSLSQLASQATLFSPSLPTPVTNKSMANGKVKKRVPEEDSSSSSSSDTDEANGSEHIPRERRVGSVLGMRKKKGILSRM